MERSNFFAHLLLLCRKKNFCICRDNALIHLQRMCCEGFANLDPMKKCITRFWYRERSAKKKKFLASPCNFVFMSTRYLKLCWESEHFLFKKRPFKWGVLASFFFGYPSCIYIIGGNGRDFIRKKLGNGIEIVRLCLIYVPYLVGRKSSSSCKKNRSEEVFYSNVYLYYKI